jgi:hypothetical protein
MHRLTARFLLLLALVGNLAPLALAATAPPPRACCLRKGVHSCHDSLASDSGQLVIRDASCCDHDCLSPRFSVPFAASSTILSTVPFKAHITLKGKTRTGPSPRTPNDKGEFEFNSVPIGGYTVTVSSQGFQQMQQGVIVQSDTSPVLHFELAVAGGKETVSVSGAPVEATLDSVTPTTMVNREDIQETPGADRTNGMQMITDYVPAAYVTHDMLHMRGRPPGRVADRRRPHPQHEHRHQSGTAD